MLLGSTSWRIRRIDNVGGKVYVEDAHGAPPSVPFWFGEAPGRTNELSKHVSELRAKIDELTKTVGLEFGAHSSHSEEVQKAIDWITSECGLSPSGAEQLIEYVVQGRAVLGAVPTVKQVIAERFFDEGGGMQLILHTPFGARINRAWGLALRKKFCRSFNLELQAAATEDGLSIALSEHHSFPLGDVFFYLTESTVQHTLEQAALASPIFATRWKWDAARSLALLRFMNGKRVQPYLQRLRSDDLLAAVFPSAAACQDNNPGDILIPEHPLIEEVMKDVLTEAMDLPGLVGIIRDIKEGKITCIAVDTPTPSQFAAEIINANVYAYLDDAGPEERRTRAVQMRRILPDSTVGELGHLDEKAIAKVIEQAWPDVRDADELHDLLFTMVAMPETSALLHENPGEHWQDSMKQLINVKRATKMIVDESTYWVCAERVAAAKTIWPAARFVKQLPATAAVPEERDGLILYTVRSFMSLLGPATVCDIASLLQLPEGDVERAVNLLEIEGRILRGHFLKHEAVSHVVTALASLPLSSYDWCERRLLAKIHKLTLATLRKAIEPVTAAVYARWLASWQHLAPGTQLVGERGLMQILRQLQGFELPANAWESQVLARRVKGYKEEMLDSLCLKGLVGWGRFSVHSKLPAAQEAEEVADKAAAKATAKAAKASKAAAKDASKVPVKIANKDASAPSKTLRLAEDLQPDAAEYAGVIKRVIPASTAPIAFFVRDDADWMATLPRSNTEHEYAGLSSTAQAVAAFLKERGASFFADIVSVLGQPRVKIERALWELVTAGLVTADGFDNLRTLISPNRREIQRPGRSGRFKDYAYGRWSLLHAHQRADKQKGLESMCQVLLARYGVVFRDVVQREANLPPWRELLGAFRHMEDRGEVRGGRFVLGFIGEQFALPQAADSLRAAKRQPEAINAIEASSADPLNLIGTVLPGEKVSAISTKMIVLPLS